MNPARRPGLIGIRPTIDGRRQGVREALEDKTLRLARNVANLLEDSIRGANGQPIKCIVPETTIGGIREAVAVDRRFRKDGVAAVVTVTPSWCYPFETMNADPYLPRAIWGFNGTERPGAVYLAALASAHDQTGYPIFKIYGQDIQDQKDNTVPEQIQNELFRFARAAIAVDAMRDTAYLSIGGVSMGISSSKVDDAFLRAYLGMRYEYVDMSELTRRIDLDLYDREEYALALSWTRQYMRLAEDPNPPERRRSSVELRSDWEVSLKMTLIIRDLMAGQPALETLGYREEADGHYSIAAGFQGQRQWTDHRPTGDMAETILNSPFDWNGIRPQYIVATENDHLNAIAMLFGNLLSGESQVFADVRTYWSHSALLRVASLPESETISGLEDGFIFLTNSGSAAMDGSCAVVRGDTHCIVPFWEFTKIDADTCLQNMTWAPAKLWTFRGGGFSASFTTKGSIPLTMFRLNLVKGIGPVLQLAEGYSVELPEHLYTAVVKRTDPTWPKTFFVPRTTESGAFRDVYTVMKRWGSNHCVLCYDHRGDDLITLASMLRIPVSMHNVPEKCVFRPTYWEHFGEADSQAADFGACKALGPLYGKY